jgi:hypothetical protein
MFSTKIRTTIATLAATFAVAVALSMTVTGVASAAIAGKQPGDSPQTATGKSVGGQRAGRPLPTNPQPIAPVGGANVAKDGGSTGDGPADDEECEQWAHQINSNLDLAEGSLESGKLGDYMTSLAAAVKAEDEGSSRGCFFIDEDADID